MGRCSGEDIGGLLGVFSFPSQSGRAEEARLPLIARLTLYALGAVEGRRIRRPVDPVAAWLIRTHPKLLHSETAPAAFTTIRARTSVIDALLGEEVAVARQNREKLSLWSFGCGFDARWYRLLPVLSDTVAAHHEIESAGLLAYKNKLLADSPYGALWNSVVLEPNTEADWRIGNPGKTRPVVIMEGLAGRLEPAALRSLLTRVRAATPTARVLIGLPGYGGTPGTWGDAQLNALGWRAETDVRLAPRGRLVAQSGKEICAGMHGLRVLRLIAL